ncbi:FKBP-type peptidyl-prolyl cis-trans isomerase [Flavihumibacter solisilvae]|jgi:FKBP-type peptidyl-prolyl cis-trans isomerase|uniref:FKBP-type peptidyl-prolyl cis-trans isomerase n=1 Tax=Flavihumibacter solisilvae TaxID=1349421 RepID=UPI00068F8654|nr:FKBP-type peptidyl-prolyl cis-trans isomerase [Flavihumibacter solisilvae]
MTKSTLFSTAIAAIMMAACGSADYSKTPSGITYKIVEKGSGPQVKLGQFLKVHYTQKVNDSILGTSHGGVPAFARVDSVGAVYNPAEVFRFVHKGDSVVVVQEVDSLLKQNPMGLPPFMKKGDKLYLTFRVVDVLENEQQVQQEQQKEMAGQEGRDQAALDAYLKKNNIKAEKVGKGTYVSVQTPGEGVAADSGKYVSVKYRGKLLSGKEFESTMEPGKDPIGFVLGQGQVIPGWDEGLKKFAKGGKGTLYIPGFLAYGMRPGPGGQQNEALVFDIEMVDIADKAPEAKQNPMMKPVDSVRAHPSH